MQIRNVVILIEEIESNHSFQNNKTTIRKKVIVYNEDSKPTVKVTMDNENKFVAEERYYYRNKVLVRYTADDNLSDTVLSEERLFDDLGNIVLHNDYSFGTTWKYYYNASGLLEREEYFQGGTISYCRRYKYK